MKIGYTELAQMKPGAYEATLKTIHAYTGTKYGTDDVLEPLLKFIWSVDDGEEQHEISDLVRIPRDPSGAPVVADESKLLNRVSSLHGHQLTPIEVDQLGFELVLPGRYDAVEMLVALPHWNDRREEGFTPVVVQALRLGGVELIGRSAQVSLIKKEKFLIVSTTLPLPKRRGKAN